MDTLVGAKLDLQTYLALKEKVLGRGEAKENRAAPDKTVN